MNSFSDFLSRLLSGLLKLTLGLAAFVFLLGLLAASLVLVLGVSLWALLTGRKPAPVMAFQRFRQTSQRYAQGAWVRRPGPAHGAAQGDVVDVQAHVVPDEPPARQRASDAAPRSGADPMARMQHR